MASENNKKLQLVFAPILKAQGFKKDGATWRKYYPETIGVVNIQGSQWGPQFYVNLGVLFRDMDQNEKPREYHCHIRLRLEGIVPDLARINQLLDFDLPVPDEERSQELSALVTHYAIPFLEQFSTQVGARESIHQYPFAAIRLGARKVLELPSST